jgi:hypothetical protein
MIEYTAVPYIGQRRCWRYRFRLFDRFFFYGLSKAHSGTAAVLVDEFDAGGSFLALRFLADGRDLKSSKDWVRFAKTSPALTASALAAFEVGRRVRHRSRR